MTDVMTSVACYDLYLKVFMTYVMTYVAYMYNDLCYVMTDVMTCVVCYDLILLCVMTCVASYDLEP